MLPVALLAAALAVRALPASACDDEANACSCGAAHAAAATAQPVADHHDMAAGCGGDPDHPGSCQCAGASAASDKPQAGAAAAAPNADAKAASDAAKGQAHQVAVVDPATGQLTEPASGEEPAGSAPARAAAARPEQVAQPGGGVMAGFPADRAASAEATIDSSGAAHTDCGH
jgi:hypothetical protein